MPRATLSLACLWWLTLIGAAAAQSGLNSNDPGVASLQNFSGGVAFNGTYFQVQNVAGNGVGWRNGFTQLGTLTPYWVNDDLVVAANGRLLITDNQQIGGNIGGIVRYYHDEWDRILGANAYYDIDQTAYQNNYRQGGFGIESLGQWWDFRANGYVPTSSGNNFLQAVGLGQDPFFFGNRVGFRGVGLYEQSLYGGDFEFGVPVTPETPWLRAFSGMYFYQGNGHGEDPIGYRGRLEGWVSDDLSLGMTVTHDSQFGTNVNANVNFLFSGWKPTRWFPNLSTQDRMLTPVQRNWRIATSQYNDKVDIPAFNPRTNQPYFVTWVDNSQAAPGNGTFETPFNTLPGTAPGADLILVRVGNTTAAAPLSGSIQLSDFQRMLGEGRDHKFDAYAQFGKFSVPLQTFSLPDPGFVDTGLYPFLTSAGNTVTIANNNEVSAFNLVDAVGAGITNGAGGSHNFNLNHLNLTNNAGGGILLTNASGVGVIDTVNALNNAAGGIFVDSSTNPLNITLRDVTSNGSPAGGQLFGVNIHADGPVTATLDNVTANGNGTGIILTETNSSLQAVLTDVTAINNVNDGLDVTGVNGTINLSLTNVNTSNNGGRGIFVNGNDTDIAFSMTGLTDNTNGDDNINFTLINGSTLSGGLADTAFDGSLGGSGIVLSTDTNSRIGTSTNPFTIRNVSADGNNEQGLEISALGGSRQFLDVTGGSFSDNGIDGIQQIQAGGSVVVLDVASATIDRNIRDGYHMEVSDGSTARSTFDQSTLDDNGRSAIFGDVDLIGTGGSLVDLTLTDTTGLRSGADGMRFNTNNGANVAVNVTDGDFSNSGQTTAGSSAVRFDSTDSEISLRMTRTPGQNTAPFPAGTQEFGLTLNLNNTLFNGAVTDGNFSNNLQDGIRIIADNFSTATLGLNNVDVNGNGIDGMIARSTNGTDVVVNATDSSFSNNGQSLAGQGLDLGVDGTAAVSRLTVNLDNTAVDSNTDEGVLGTATGTAANAGLLVLNTTEGTTINGNGADGVRLVNTSGIVRANFTDTDISFNVGNGVAYDGTGLGASPSRVEFHNTGISGTTNNNGLDGFNYRVQNGNQLVIDATFAEFSNNGESGIDGYVNGPSAGVIINQLLGVAGDNNGEEGFKLLVDNTGTFNGSVNGGSFSNNGQAGVFDGVNVVVDNNGFARICFDGTAVDGNTDDGFDFLAQNGGTLNVALQTSGAFGTLSASDNADQAVVFNVLTGASGNLFMDGPNEFNNNGSAVAAIQYTANTVAQAAFSFSGTSDGNTGDAINVSMTNVADAYIDIHGPGSLSNNGSNGVDIALNTVTFGATPLSVDFIQGTFSARPFNITDLTIDGNGDEGIKIVGNAVNMPVGSNGTISGNSVSGNGTNVAGADGILVTLTGGGTIDSLVMDDNQVNDNNGVGLNFSASGGYNIGTLAVTNGGYSNNLGNAGDPIGEGIRLSTNGGTVNLLDISGNTINQNAGVGALVTTTNTTFTTVTFDGNTIDENQDHGLSLVATGSPMTTLNITDNGIHGNTNHGVNIDLNGSDITNLNVARNDIAEVPPLPLIGYSIDFFNEHVNHANLSQNGILIDSITYDFSPIGYSLATTRGAGSDFEHIFGGQATGFVTVNGNPVDLTLTAQPGIVNDGDTLMTLGFTDFDNADGTLHVDFVVGDATAAAIQTGTDLAGVITTALFSNGDTLVGVFDGNAAHNFIRAAVAGAGNGGDGIHIEQVNSDISNLLFDENNISGNGGDGIDFAVVSNSIVGPTTFSDNTISSNGGDGIRIVDPNLPGGSKALDITATGNTIDLNTGNGINLQITNNENVTLTMTGNTIGTEGNGNGGMGVRAVITGTGSFEGNIGSNAVGAVANTFTANRDAGFGLTMSDNTTGGMTVVNSSFNGTTNGADAAFAGVGLGINLSDAARLDPLHLGSLTAQNTNFNGNAADGFLLQMSDTSRIVGTLQLYNVQANENGGNGAAIELTNSSAVPATITTLDVRGNLTGATFSNNGGNGFLLTTNSQAVVSNVNIQEVTANENGGDGLNFFRQGSSSITNTTINLSEMNDNTGDGIDITAADLNSTDTYDITNNEVNGNNGTGMLFNLIGDADLDVSITGNTINTNGADGIRTTTNADVTDSPSILLDINNNTIDSNTGSGISINTPHIASIDTNFITNNTVDGINITGPTPLFAFDDILNNTITGNGDDGIDISAGFIFASIHDNVAISNNGDDGIALTSSFGSGGQGILIDQNLQIQGNGGDGIQISASNGSSNSYTISNNVIEDSGRRGINIVNGGGTNSIVGLNPTDTTLSITSNTVARSGLEGVYIVNTASNTQGNATNINNLSSAAMLTDGSVFAKPLLDLTMTGNTIDSNGQTHNAGNFIDATGLVLRVGSSDATNILPSSYNAADTGGTANGGRGGVVASVTGNTFTGQYAADVTFQPFISTAAPSQTVGQWTDQNTNPRVADDVFNITSYVQDPLARLDLIFTGNTGDGLVASNGGASSAFYNNDESVFKSRTQAQDNATDAGPPDDNGPFDSGTRARNATRQTFRGTLPPDLVIGTSNTFRYSGLGANNTALDANNGSTFRIQSGFANTFTLGNTSFSNGISIGGGTGEAPFIWGTFP
jgi:hypothetical protein